jgi:hypothetical protein
MRDLGDRPALATVRIVEAHGGAVRVVDSELAGAGSEVALPLASEAPRPGTPTPQSTATP